MNLLKSLHALLGGSQPKNTPIERVEPTALRIDELPPFTLHTAELMRFDPQVRIGLGARNGLLMAAEVEVTGPDATAIQTGLPELSGDDWVYRTFRSPGTVTGDPTEFIRARVE